MNNAPSVESPWLPGKRRNLALLAAAELLAMSLWFSALAVVPQLTGEWSLSAAQQSWMTMSVQIGCVVGALASAMLTLSDRVPAHILFAVSAVLGATFNALIPPGADGPQTTIWLRFATGITLAGVYPPGMKLMATWCRVCCGGTHCRSPWPDTGNDMELCYFGVVRTRGRASL